MTRFTRFALPLSLALSVAVPQAAVAQDAAAPVNAAEFAGKPLYGPKGERIGAVYKVTGAGVPQLIIDGKIISVPVSSLSVTEGKLTTSLDKKSLVRGKR